MLDQGGEEAGDRAGTRIDSDTPTERDDLGREPYVRTLARIVRTAETPLVIAIYGAWGAGKTSLMMQLRRQLDPGYDDPARANSAHEPSGSTRGCISLTIRRRSQCSTPQLISSS